MEILLSAVLGELTARSINFFISKIFKPTPLDVEDRHRRVLIRAQIIIDEATGRHITNQAMLLQLAMLRDAVHRGYYTLDTFRCQSIAEEDSKDHIVSRSSPLFKVNPLNGLCSSSGSTQILEHLREALDRLSSMIIDVDELVMFLTNHPRLYCQPYSMHLQLTNCMFGRQMEAQLVINFLLSTQPHRAEELDVLPIVGPTHVGKSTLVAHACKDERVRDHFLEIIFLRSHSFTEDELATFREGCARKHQNHASNSGKDGTFLIVVELDGDLNEDSWNRLYSACKRCVPRGSKIIVMNRSDKIARFGTTRALTLKYLSHEAYWYFFKTLTFGSTDPEMHPRLMHVAMEIHGIGFFHRSSFLRANMMACLLRNNFDLHFWRKVLAFLRGPVQKYASRLGEHPLKLLEQGRPVRVGRMATTSEVFVIYHLYQRPAEEEVPKITMQDIAYGSIKPHGKVEVLEWRSPIPPYYSYICTCEIRDLKNKAVKRKRFMEGQDTLC